MADANEQSGPRPGASEDLFDFPIVGGLEEFGLVPPDTTPVAPATPATPAADVEASPMRPSPPAPADVAGPDEDLFDLDEVLNLENDPFDDGVLDASGQPARSAPAPASVVSRPEEPAADSVAPFSAAPERALTSAQPQPASAPARPEPTVEAAPSPETVAAELQTTAPLPSPEDLPAAPAPVHSQGTRHRDRGPRLSLPQDVPDSLTGNNGRLITALIACFLTINTGIFFLAHRASSSVNESLSQATGLIADAISARGRSEAPLRGAQPPQFSPDVSHEIERQQSGPREADEKEIWIDPRDYKNPHEFAVGNAKKMMEEGRFEEARRLLYWVLANQQRAPLAPSMRTEIDYLIPLTYYQQGRATGLEQEGQ